MNKIIGNILDIRTEGGLSVVDLQSNDLKLKAILIDTPETLPELQIGAKVDVLFKETEVIIGVGEVKGISMRNKIPVTIEKINQGRLLSHLQMKSSVGVIESIITVQAVQQLGLAPGKQVWAMVKTNEVILEFK